MPPTAYVLIGKNTQYYLSSTCATFPVSASTYSLYKFRSWSESTIMGERRLRIRSISRDVGINPGTIRRIFNEAATRIELNVVEAFCEYL